MIAFKSCSWNLGVYSLFVYSALVFQIAHAQDLTIACENGVELDFTYTLVDTTVIKRVRMDRNPPKASDVNCAGKIDIIGCPKTDCDNQVDSIIIEIGPTAFQNLPEVTNINFEYNRVSESRLEMYEGSPNIESMNFIFNNFKILDATTQFPKNLKILLFEGNAFFNEIKADFFDENPSLTELDISSPQNIFGSFIIESSFLKTASKLKTLHMNAMQITHLSKSIFSDASPSITHIHMSNWILLKTIDPNVFGDLTLDTLDLEGLRYPDLGNGLLDGASIRNLNLKRTSMLKLMPGGLSGLQNSLKIDFSSGALTAIEIGAFNDFDPLDNFEFYYSRNKVLCCEASGLQELTSKATGLTINGNSDTYDCVHPNTTVISVPFGVDSAMDLPCCTDTQYFDLEENECLECSKQEFCASSINDCKGTKLACEECRSGYHLVDSICQACSVQIYCTVPINECLTDADSEDLLQCETCAEGFAVSSDTKLCSDCLELSPSCVTYDNSCVVDSQKLACKICNDDTLLIEGNCVTVDDLSLPMGTVIGISIGSIVIVALVSLILLRVCLRWRKKRKEKELLNSCGIFKNESGVELHPVEFTEPAISGQNALYGSEHLQGPHTNLEIIGSNVVDEYIDCRIQLTKTDLNNEEQEEYVQLGIQNDNANDKEKQNASEHLDPKPIPLNLKMPSECSDGEEIINSLNNRTNEKENKDDNDVNAAEYVELGVQKECPNERIHGTAPSGSNGASDQYWDPCRMRPKNSTSRSSIVDANYWDSSFHENKITSNVDYI